VGLASSRPGPYQNLLLQRIVLAANQFCTQNFLALHPQQTDGHDRGQWLAFYAGQPLVPWMPYWLRP
jgi:hypothetical protein